MLKRLKIELRQKQLYKNSDPTKPIIVQCNSDGTSEYITGTVPFSSWQDFTDDVENLDELKLSWQAGTQNNNEGDAASANEFGSNYSKGVTLELRFYGAAFTFIESWLMLEPCQILNAIEARITDLDCAKRYRIFELKLENTRQVKTEPCIVSLRLSEADSVWHSFQKTIIEDDWQGWFNSKDDATKMHPCFLYVVEKRPKFFLTVLVGVAYFVGCMTVNAISIFNEGREWVRKMLGICYFCPSPLIRTYIENICLKYGYTWDTIFDDKPENPYRNTCLFFPVEKSVEDFENFEADDTRFIWANRTGLPFAKFLDQLKKVFNCEWYVTPNKQLIFKPRAEFDAKTPVYDFTTGIFELIDLEYTFNGKKKPAYGQYMYSLDPSDGCVNEIKWRYDAVVDYDGPAENPLLEGSVTRQFDFSQTAFNKDGTVKPFLEEAIKTGRIVGYVAALIGLAEIFGTSNFITALFVVALVTTGYIGFNDIINNFFKDDVLDGVVRLANNQINRMRLLLWDGTSPLNQARVIWVEDPEKNLYYNLDNKSYYEEHPTHDDVGLFGGDITRIYNYPMYVDEKFKDNLFDRFHEYDNPLKNNIINQDWTGKVVICCETLDILGVWENDFAKIGAVVILEKRGTRLIKGRIESFDVDYKAGFINLAGRVLK